MMPACAAGPVHGRSAVTAGTPRRPASARQIRSPRPSPEARVTGSSRAARIAWSPPGSFLRYARSAEASRTLPATLDSSLLVGVSRMVWVGPRHLRLLACRLGAPLGEEGVDGGARTGQEACRLGLQLGHDVGRR